MKVKKKNDKNESEYYQIIQYRDYFLRKILWSFSNKFLFFFALYLSLITNNFQFSKYCAYLLKFLTSTTHVIYRILTLHGIIIIGNKILFKFEYNKKQILC